LICLETIVYMNPQLCQSRGPLLDNCLAFEESGLTVEQESRGYGTIEKLPGWAIWCSIHVKPESFSDCSSHFDFFYHALLMGQFGYEDQLSTSHD
jgi:hypothetical protein